MGTPFIARLEPSRQAVGAYVSGVPSDQQPPSVPRTFKDAMRVREEVFVGEQGFSFEAEFDVDDPRSCHWVIYASVNQMTTPEIRDKKTGELIHPRRSHTESVPIGTLRIVPFPHPPHPPDGAQYVHNVLQPPHVSVGNKNSDDGGSAAAEERTWVDRATDMHNGQEPYVKLGRVAVVPAFRGRGIAAQLWRAAVEWLQRNPSCFNPSVRFRGMDNLQAATPDEIPKWGGLVCVHAQEDAINVYERWGFQVDKGMGRWFEDGVPHVGMFLRLPLPVSRLLF